MATSFFGGAFFGGEFFSTPSQTPEANSGGYEVARLGPRRKTAEDIRRERVEYGVIKEVASRQAADPSLDDRQRIEELAGELKLRGLELESAHIEALNARREQIIRDELQAIFRQQQDDRDIAALIILAASA